MARPRSDIRPRIVDSARARFLSLGVDGASLREIARDAGTNIGMVAYYFPTKDDLFLAVVEEVYASEVADLSIGLLFRAVGKPAAQARSGRPPRGDEELRPKREPTRAGGEGRAPRGRRSR